MSTSAATTSTARDVAVDNLKVLVVAGVIVAHTATGYITDVADWYYDELTTSELWSTLLAFPIVAAGLFGLGPLFLIAGWYSPRSLARHGVGGFVQRRLLRLGLPLLAFVLLVQPLADYVGSRRDDVRTSLASALRDTEFSVMWFVAALLVFSAVYAALRWIRRAHAPRRPVRLEGALILAAASIAVTSFALWQIWPWNSDALRSMRIGEWPQGAGLFALGVHAAESGWLDDPRPALMRRLGRVAVVGTVATVTLFAVLDVRDEAEAVLDHAAGWPTILFALLDGTVAVSLTLWLVVRVRSRWSRQGRVVAMAARGCYATYVVHPLVITSLMVLLAPVVLAPEVKFLVVGTSGVGASFALGHVLTKVPGLSRIV